MTESNYSIRSVERVCDLLDLIQDRPGQLTLVELSEVTGLPKSSTFRYLQTLEDRRYIERSSGGTYGVGVALRTGRIDAIVDRARPILMGLRDELGETVNIGRLDGGEVTYLAVIESLNPVRNSVSAGDREELHSTALGKAIAATLPESEVVAVLERSGMPKRTEHTIDTVEAFLEELETVRLNGYALDERENTADGRCIAVVIHGTAVPMALSLSAPEFRLPRDEVGAVAAALIEAARRVSPRYESGNERA